MEEKIYSLFNKIGLKVIKNNNEKGIDLLLIQGGVEVKFDSYAQKSGNFYIEFEYNGKPSGIFKEELYDLSYWVHSDGIKAYILDGLHFKQDVINLIDLCRKNKTLTHKQYRVIEQGGDGGKTKGLLLPISYFEYNSRLIFNI